MRHFEMYLRLNKDKK